MVQFLLSATQAYFGPGYPVISATREKKAFLNPEWIVQPEGCPECVTLPELVFAYPVK